MDADNKTINGFSIAVFTVLHLKTIIAGRNIGVK